MQNASVCLQCEHPTGNTLTENNFRLVIIGSSFGWQNEHLVFDLKHFIFSGTHIFGKLILTFVSLIINHILYSVQQNVCATEYMSIRI